LRLAYRENHGRRQGDLLLSPVPRMKPAQDQRGPHTVIKVGCCGFSKARAEYFQHFSLVEVQRTFYKLPRLETCQRWRAEAPPAFEFTLKAWQLITHRPTSPTYRKAKLKVDRPDRYGSFRPSDEVLGAWEDTLEVGVSCRLSFASAPVPPAILSGAYPVTLHLYGTDFNGAEYGDTVITTGRNWVTVKTPARFEILAVIAGSDTVSWGEANVPVDVVVQNGGGADASLDSTNLRFLRGTDNLDDDFLETLLNSIDLVRGTCTEILHFSVKVDSSDTTGWATIHSRVFGSDKNSGEPICDTTADLPDSFYVTAGYACGDCNGDGNIAFMDALYLVCFMYRSGPMPLGSGDVNLDGRITFADALQIKNYFYQTPPGSPAPCQPRASSRRVIDGAHRDR